MSTVTEADILTEVVAPGSPDLSPDAARSIFALEFKASAIQRMNDLADKNNRGEITAAQARKWRSTYASACFSICSRRKRAAPSRGPISSSTGPAETRSH